ncbi:hypothetical protein VTL71DRAFT_455 [Oculimacula yallundae]|uniref:Uncharacterized protein n=1 Tax=Oculimacula yallundae TaxID=86028 RepID=A0ABR4D127_9HELO
MFHCCNLDLPFVEFGAHVFQPILPTSTHSILICYTVKSNPKPSANAHSIPIRSSPCMVRYRKKGGWS